MEVLKTDELFAIPGLVPVTRLSDAKGSELYEPVISLSKTNVRFSVGVINELDKDYGYCEFLASDENVVVIFTTERRTNSYKFSLNRKRATASCSGARLDHQINLTLLGSKRSVKRPLHRVKVGANFEVWSCDL